MKQIPVKSSKVVGWFNKIDIQPSSQFQLGTQGVISLFCLPRIPAELKHQSRATGRCLVIKVASREGIIISISEELLALTIHTSTGINAKET